MSGFRLTAVLLVACTEASALQAGSPGSSARGPAALRQRHPIDLMYSVETGPSNARFRVQYDGSTDEPLGLAVLRVLDGAWAEYSDRLGCRPTQPVPVTLLTAAGFQDTTRAPEWAAGWNDGTIRVPVRGLSEPTPDLVRVLRHELAHSFVAAGAGPRCPIWLHEGIAQWLEGGDPAREDAALAARARETRLPRLESLETSFVTLSKPDAENAYAASLSAVAYIVALRGEPGVRQLLKTLADGQSITQALPRALRRSYGDLQDDWEHHVRGMEKDAPDAAAHRSGSEPRVRGGGTTAP